MRDYETALHELAKADRDLASRVARMGVPHGVWQSDPYWQKHYWHWVLAMAENYTKIASQAKKRKVDLSALPRSSTPVVVIGSGPSLTPAIPHLQRWRGEIICSNSNLYTLLHYGIRPTYLVVLDAAGGTAALTTAYKHIPRDLPLITHPMANPTLLNRWRGPVFYFLVQRLGSELFLWTLPTLYGERFKDRHSGEQVGCGIFTGLAWRVCVSNNCVQVASSLGAPDRPIFLVGTDFGWMERAFSRCETFHPTDDGSALRRVTIAPPESTKEDPIRRSDDGIERTDDMAIKRDEFFKMWANIASPVVDCTGGYMHELPQADIADVVAKGGKGWEWVRERSHVEATVEKVGRYMTARAAVKRAQYKALRRAEDEETRGDSDAGAGGAGTVAGGDGGAAGEGGPGA